MSQEAIEPDNPFTRLAHEIKAINQGRGSTTGVVSVDRMPSVRSASMQANPIDTEQEKRRLNVAALKAGVTPEALGMTPEDASALLQVQEAPLMEYRDVPLPASGTRSGPRLMPDLTKIEGIDLVRNVAIVDGIEFPVPLNEINLWKGYVIQLVTDVLTQRVADALLAFGLVPGGTREAMHSMSANQTAREFLQGQENERRKAGSLQEVSQLLQLDAPETGTESSVDGGLPGDSIPLAEPPRVQPKRRGRPRKKVELPGDTL